MGSLRDLCLNFVWCTSFFSSKNGRQLRALRAEHEVPLKVLCGACFKCDGLAQAAVNVKKAFRSIALNCLNTLTSSTTGVKGTCPALGRPNFIFTPLRAALLQFFLLPISSLLAYVHYLCMITYVYIYIYEYTNVHYKF